MEGELEGNLNPRFWLLQFFPNLDLIAFFSGAQVEVRGEE